MYGTETAVTLSDQLISMQHDWARVGLLDARDLKHRQKRSHPHVSSQHARDSSIRKGRRAPRGRTTLLNRSGIEVNSGQAPTRTTKSDRQ